MSEIKNHKKKKNINQSINILKQNNILYGCLRYLKIHPDSDNTSFDLT